MSNYSDTIYTDSKPIDKSNLVSIARWLYSDLNRNLQLYKRLFEDILLNEVFTNGNVSCEVVLTMLANNSISITLKNSAWYDQTLLYVRDPLFVDTFKLRGDYYNVDSEFIKIIEDSGQGELIIDTLLNYSWVISQSREYKLDILLEE